MINPAQRRKWQHEPPYLHLYMPRAASDSDLKTIPTDTLDIKHHTRRYYNCSHETLLQQMGSYSTNGLIFTPNRCQPSSRLPFAPAA